MSFAAYLNQYASDQTQILAGIQDHNAQVEALKATFKMAMGAVGAMLGELVSEYELLVEVCVPELGFAPWLEYACSSTVEALNLMSSFLDNVQEGILTAFGDAVAVLDNSGSLSSLEDALSSLELIVSGFKPVVDQLSSGISGFTSHTGSPALLSVTTNGGTSWSQQSAQLPTNLSYPVSLSCPSLGICYLEGMTTSDAISLWNTNDSGTGWSAVAMPSSMSVLSTVACPTGNSCFLQGFDGSGNDAVWTTSDSGVDWSETQLPSTIGSVVNLECSSAMVCYMAGVDMSGNSALWYSDDAGETWTNEFLPSSIGSGVSMSCPTSTDCFMLQTSSGSCSLESSGNNGATWTLVQGNPPPVTSQMPLSIVTTMPPSGTVGSPYDNSLLVSGGIAPYTWTVTSGSLPMGLSLSTSGAISGTPTTSGAYSFSVQVTDSSPSPQSVSGAMSITVNTSIGPPTVTAVSPSSGTTSGGTLLTITGTNLTGATQVTVGFATATNISVQSSTFLVATTPGGFPGVAYVTVTTPAGTSPVTSAGQFNYVENPPTTPQGYWMMGIDGGVFSFGSAVYEGSGVTFESGPGGSGAGPYVADLAPTPDGAGYTEVDVFGAIFGFGDSLCHPKCSVSFPPLHQGTGPPWDSLATTPDGKGFWLVNGWGAIATVGDATDYGSPFASGTTLCTVQVPCGRQAIQIVATPDGKGYWILGADGGIFTYGDAEFYGSTGAMKLAAPVVAMAATPDGRGYWLVAEDGGVFTFGDALFYGSMGGKPLNAPIDAATATSDGKGYLMVATDGGVFTFGDAQFLGSMGGKPLAAPVIAVAAVP